jgi:hypothetical protein
VQAQRVAETAETADNLCPRVQFASVAGIPPNRRSDASETLGGGRSLRGRLPPWARHDFRRGHQFRNVP